ncbi:MAG: CAP domain-containing protein [Verrucomicrobiota bacterium]
MSQPHSISFGGSSSRAALVAVGLFAAFCRIALAWTPGTASPNAVQGFVVDSMNRTDALSFYNTIYAASGGYADHILWTGNLTTGAAGTTGAAFKEDVRRRVNFFRAINGLPADIVFNDTKSSKCQEAALMFSANSALNHFPPSNWTYYTANGYEAAGNSNIALGNFGPGAVDAFIRDDGSNNTIVGHRRWLLYSLAQEMGTGDIPPNGSYNSANAIWVIGNFKASATSGFVAWPNKGFVSQDLVPARWSLSYPGAGFGSAAVTMTQNGSPVPVTIISRTDNGYGENTIVWEPSGLQVSGLQDVSFSITVSGIGGAGVPASYSYSVTAFNPGVLGQSVTITGPATPPVTGQAYTFNPITQADQYQLRVSTGSSAAWSEGAENLSAITDRSAPDYPLAQTTVKRSGSQAFHLTFPSFAAGDQGFEINRDIIPSAASQLAFYDLFRWVTTASRLSVELSEDSGSTWTEIWTRNGNGSVSSADWDTSFNARSVSLAAYAGRPVRIRFVFRANNSAFLGTDTNRGVFLDDISISNATEMVNTTTSALAGSATTFTLNATTAGASLVAGTSYYLRIRPNVGTRWFGDGPIKLVTAQAAPASPFATWQGNQFTAGDIAAGLTEMAADFDNDGLPNLLEYAFGKIPKVPDVAAISPNVSGNKMQVAFPCDASCTDITYTVQSSSTLAQGDWTDIAKSVGGTATAPINSLSTVSDPGTGLRTVTVTETAAFIGKRFLRVKITSP